MTAECSNNTNPLKLIREGSRQDQRFSPALDPDYAPADERTLAHRMVFAQAYAQFLKFYNADNVADGNWTSFFSNDVSVQFAIAAVQDVASYKATIKLSFDYLKNSDHQSEEDALKERLGYLFSSAATLAKQLDLLKEGLPADIPLKSRLQNLVTSQLAPAFKKLILYHRDGLMPDPPPPPNAPYHSDVKPALNILGAAMTFQEVMTQGLSKDWIVDDPATKWDAYLANLQDLLRYPPTRIYGSGNTVFSRINHIATHHLFTSVFDQFLKALARIVGEAKQALDASLKNWDRHEPHYALFLAFLRLFEYARAGANTLTARHLDFYYRDVLRLKEKPSEPSHAHLLFELTKGTLSHLLEGGTLFRAGKDRLGIDAFFANDREIVLNQAKVAALKNVYRHGAEPVGLIAPSDKQQGRIFASPVANSDDGLGAPLTTVDQSWHPFHNKVFQDGLLSEIRMPKAEIGWAIASHYFLLAEGTRTITVSFTIAGAPADLKADSKEDVVCFLTGEEGWIEKEATGFIAESGVLQLELSLTGADPAVMPYAEKVHGYGFATDLPILIMKLRHREDAVTLYSPLQDIVVQKIDLTVDVKGLRTLTVSNDFGPVDTSKPFQPYGALPVANNALVIGSREVFQKQLLSASITASWLVTPDPYKTSPTVSIDYLKGGQWVASNLTPFALGSDDYDLGNALHPAVVDAPDLNQDTFYGTASRHGFLRLKLNGDIGQNTYQKDLIAHLRKDTDAKGKELPHPGDPPAAPVMTALSINYTASQTLTLDSSNADAFDGRAAHYFHLAPFGHAEQHPLLNTEAKVYLLPRFGFQRDGIRMQSEAECYVGISGLKPPQNLTMLMQVAPGTADPLSEKPDAHLHWSYLRDNEWIAFAGNAVEDQTRALLESGIVTLSVPRDASDANTLLPQGIHWIRIAVASKPDAVCRLRMIAAQAAKATFSDRGNAPDFAAQALPPDTITKLDEPDAAIKKVAQPFTTFGGRAAEAPAAFYTRISERLRHKDRAISLWDYEHLILEAFPQIYKVRCLNHTQYEPDESGAGIYRELAAGHVTIVTIPNLQSHNLRDPLRPYTDLGLLQEIAAFLRKRLSCFVRLHVRNPQFEQVTVHCKVRLHEGFDETFYVTRLQEEIMRFLSPWAFPGGASPSFGGKIYKSVLINMVEELPYVDYVTDFRLFHDVEGGSDKNEVEGSKAVSILVSAPAKKHVIDVIHVAEEARPGEQCTCEE